MSGGAETRPMDLGTRNRQYICRERAPSRPAWALVALLQGNETEPVPYCNYRSRSSKSVSTSAPLVARQTYTAGARFMAAE
jgi:hypothetical protein